MSKLFNTERPKIGFDFFVYVTGKSVAVYHEAPNDFDGKLLR